MTEIFNASLAAAASTTELAVAALEPHGINAEVECRVACLNETTEKLFTLARVPAGESVVVFPTTDVMVVTNISAGAGVVQVTAKA